MSPYKWCFKNGHMSNGQWSFNGMPHVIIIMAKAFTIEINPWIFNFQNTKIIIK
jgi:hypothetical protein